MASIGQETDTDPIWDQLRREALEQSEAEPYLASYFYATVLAHGSLEHSLAFHLANKLANATLLSTQLFSLFLEIFDEDLRIQVCIDMTSIWIMVQLWQLLCCVETFQYWKAQSWCTGDPLCNLC